MRKLRLKGTPVLTTVKQKAERRDNIRLEKAEQRAQLESQIEKELLDRLKLGTYGELYEDLYNLNPNAMDKYIEEKGEKIEEDISDEESLELEVI